MEVLTKDEVQSFLEQFHAKLNVFGKDVKEREVYIKIMLSEHCKQTICISFHIAEQPLKYQFK